MKVKVLSADAKSKRIALSMKALMPPTPKNSRPNSPQPVPEPHLLAALLCRRPVQRYAATSEVTLHSYPATRFARIPPAYGGRSLELAGSFTGSSKKLS